MAKDKMRSYQVQAVVVVQTAIEVMASSPEQALEKAKALDQDDFVEVYGDCMDSNFRISGIYESDGI